MRIGPVVGVSVLLIATGCSSGADPELAAATTTLAPTSIVPLPVDVAHQSTATLEIDGTTWRFDVSCAQPTEAEILVWGSGEDPDTDLPAELLLEASAANPYVGVTASGRLIEASLDGPLSLVVDAGSITGDDVAFVADADIDTGLGEDLGTGSVQVDCTVYESSPLSPG